MEEYYQNNLVKIYHGNCLDIIPQLDIKASAVVTDPPYELGFMGKSWDSKGVSFQKETWQIIRNSCISGAPILAFGGSRTFHRIAVAIEDAGWELRDTIMWVYGCLSEDTEILTVDGFKRYNELQRDVPVYSFNMDKNCIEISNVDNIFIYNCNDRLINLRNNNTDQLVTLNHKVICKLSKRKQLNYTREDKYNKNWDWVFAKDISTKTRKMKLPLGGIYDGDISIGVDMASLLGWVLTEGHFYKGINGTWDIRIYQSDVNKENVNTIRDLLNRMGINHSEYIRKRKYKDRFYKEHCFYINGEWKHKIAKIIPNKKPTYELLKLKYAEKVALYEAMMLGDGSKNNNQFYQNDIATLEWFQILCHLIGKQGRINYKKGCVAIHNNPTTEFQVRHLKQIKEVNYKGKVWSIQTNNMSYIARRNGKIFITGNSGFPKSLDISKAIDKSMGAEREVVGIGRGTSLKKQNEINVEQGFRPNDYYKENDGSFDITAPTTPEAKLWEGYGTALKPAFEPIILGMNHLDGTFANNALKHGVAGLNIDGCRVPYEGKTDPRTFGGSWKTDKAAQNVYEGGYAGIDQVVSQKGRFPSNFIHDGSQMVMELFPDSKNGAFPREIHGKSPITFRSDEERESRINLNDNGSAARFFYCAKASKSERNKGCEDIEPSDNLGYEVDTEHPYKSGHRNDNNTNQLYMGITGKLPTKQHNNHPTVKPLALMEYLCKLVKYPEYNLILDPFMGSGTTLLACIKLNIPCMGIDSDEKSCEIAVKRCEAQIKEFSSNGY